MLVVRTHSLVLAVLIASFGLVVPAVPSSAATAQEADEPRISDIQGTSRVSPYLGEQVANVSGVVTGVDRFGSARGFWFQDPDGDEDERSSSGLFVHTGDSTPDVDPGDDVVVTGEVAEYRPGDEQDSAHQAITQLTEARWEVRASGVPLPEPEVLDAEEIPEEFAPTGDDISERELEPDSYALDFLESRAGMRVTVSDTRVVGPTDDFNSLWVTTKAEQNPTERGGTVYNSYAEPNSGRIKVESLVPFDERPFPEADVGDVLAGSTVGPLHYSQYGGYGIQATTLGEHVSHDLDRDVAAAQDDWELSIATYNVENLAATDPQDDFGRHSRGIVDNLRSPDILGLVEIQDNSGSADDGVVDADETLDRLVDAVSEAGGPDYEWRQINPEDGADGGQPGGNIRNAFLFDPDRVDFVDIPGGDANTPARVVEVDGNPELSSSPGRVAPQESAWQNSRKPLVGQFEFAGRSVFVVTNHFTAKTVDDPLHGIRQPPERHSEEQRHQQATLVREFADEISEVDPTANVAVIGDLNDFEFSGTLQTLTEDSGMYNPMLEINESERYTYVFDGNSQALDHLLTSRNLAHRVDYEIIRVNAEFHDQASDHDPVLARFLPVTGDTEFDAAEDETYYDGAQPRSDDELDELLDVSSDLDAEPTRSAVPGVLGGVLVVALLMLGWGWWCRRRDRN